MLSDFVTFVGNFYTIFASDIKFSTISVERNRFHLFQSVFNGIAFCFYSASFNCDQILKSNSLQFGSEKCFSTRDTLLLLLEFIQISIWSVEIIFREVGLDNGSKI